MDGRLVSINLVLDFECRIASKAIKYYLYYRLEPGDFMLADNEFRLRDGWVREESDNHRTFKILSCQSCRELFGISENLRRHLKLKPVRGTSERT